MNKFETHIILIPISSMSNGRKFIKMVENKKFNNTQEVENAICFHENDPMAIEDLMIFSISDFMDCMNNQDDDTPEDEKINLDKFWLGYVQILKSV